MRPPSSSASTRSPSSRRSCSSRPLGSTRPRPPPHMPVVRSISSSRRSIQTCCEPRSRRSSGLFVQSQELQRSVDAITELNAELRASEVEARAVLQNVADAIVMAGEGGLIKSFNRAASALFGYGEDEVIGQPLQLIVAPSHHDEFSEAAQAKWSLLEAGTIPAESTETVGCRKDGSCFAMEMDISQMQIGERAFTIACVRDISGRNAYLEALAQRSLHDKLSGLPNRALLSDRMDRSITFADRSGEPRAVLWIDLDRFRELNETWGREKGDALLQAVAGRLRGAMRDSDTVARLGGDSFGVLPAGETGIEAAAATARTVREVFEQPFLITGDAVTRAGEHRDRTVPAARPFQQRAAARRGAGDGSGEAVRRRRRRCSSPIPRIRPRVNWRSSTSSATASRAASWCSTISRRSTWRGDANHRSGSPRALAASDQRPADACGVHARGRTQRVDRAC